LNRKAFATRAREMALAAGCVAFLASCGGGGSSSPPPATGATPGPTPAPTAAVCSLSARKSWTLEQLQEWYLFPDLLNGNANPTAYGSVQDYIDALVAPARAQNRDRYFTYLTSIAEENAYYEQGETAGFGFRLEFADGIRLLVNEVFEGSAAYGAGLDRGTEILQIGVPGQGMRSIGSLVMSGGTALIDALGPDTPGTARDLLIRDRGGVERMVTLTKTSFDIDPVSDVYGAKIIMDGGKPVGYINLRTFIGPAVPDLVEAFADFKAQGVTELVIDLRYNGGGLISVAQAFGDLMGEGRAGQTFTRITYRPSKSQYDESATFTPQPQSIVPSKIAFITTGGTASASEMLINAMLPYLGTQMALVGENTYGKPVGQIAQDRPSCDDRLRIIALKGVNASYQGAYYNGLDSVVPISCRASDDLQHPLGDPSEGVVRTALDFLAGRSCSSILGATATASVDKVRTGSTRKLLTPSVPRRAQDHELPGAF